MENITYHALSKEHTNALVPLYAKVFAGKPWYEESACKHCGEIYGDPKDQAKQQAIKDNTCINDLCTSNGQGLELVDLYQGSYFDIVTGKTISNLGENIYFDALEQEAFTGIAAVLQGRMIGFSWGYKLPEKAAPSVMFDKVNNIFKAYGIDTATLFYAAEVGVHPEKQGQGYGTLISKNRLQQAKDKGFQAVTFRTKNENLIKVYNKLFGEGNGLKLFKDPDPSKPADDFWYLWQFKDFKE